MRQIYLDHGATTDLLPQARLAMEPYLREKYGNASTGYALGEVSRRAVEQAREQIAVVIGAKPQEIFFTSGGSESDNWALKGTMEAGRGRHLITSCIEHHAVLRSCEYLQDLGCEVTYLPVDDTGVVSLSALEKSLRGDTALVSVMTGNNEIGTMEPVHEIAQIAHRHGAFFHTDAVQAVGQVPVSVRGIDLMSASAHKFHGPKGVGFLYVSEGVKLPPFIHGGGQESGRRAGTENVAGIVGMAVALTVADEHLRTSVQQRRQLRDHMIHRILTEIPDARLNGHPAKRLPGNVNVSFRGVDGTALLVLLQEQGVCAAAGSACSTGATTISHVISALGVDEEWGRGTLRFTIGKGNTRAEIDYVVDLLWRMVARLRG